jgi:bacillolysin
MDKQKKRIQSMIMPALMIFIFGHVQSQENPQSNRTFFYQVDRKHPVPANNALQRTNEIVSLQAHEELIRLKSSIDNHGFKHERYQLMYKGVPLENGIVIIHYEKNGNVQAITGERPKVSKDISVIPNLTESDAIGQAKQKIKAKQYYEKLEAEVVIYQERLAYKIIISALQPMSCDLVYVDAVSGEILDKISRTVHAAGTADTRYSGQKSISTTFDPNLSGYVLKDNTRGGGIVTKIYDAAKGILDLVDANNLWQANEYVGDRMDGVLDLHWGLQVTFDYFFSTHNRNSFDDAGASINATYYKDGNLQAAHWSLNSKAIYIGRGDGTSTNPWSALDVVAHELSHGICQYSANLVNQYESGSLNEGLSDIWGICVEHYANETFGLNKNIWKSASEIYLDGVSFQTNFQSPNNAAPNAQGAPDTYKGTYYNGTAGLNQDNGGVHQNSSVLSHWFYLLASQGLKQGTNDFGTAYSVTGIGIDDAAKIVYLAETQYLTPNVQYLDMRNHTIAAAKNIFGENSNEVAQVTAAWQAVGVPKIYCPVQSSNTNQVWVGSVQVMGQFIQNDNTINSKGYADYSGDPAYTLYATIGQKYTITITPTLGNVNPNTLLTWRVWIDRDTDGKFDYNTETLFAETSQGASPVSFQYEARQYADLIGFSKMRIKMEVVPGISIEPCDGLGAGETEDYDVIISPAACIAPANFTKSVSGNLNAPTVKIDWEDVHSVNKYEFKYWRAGLNPSTETAYKKSIALDVGPGQTWYYQARSMCPLGPSAWSPILSFTTSCLPPVSIYLGSPNTLTSTKAYILWNNDPYYWEKYRLYFRKSTDNAWTNHVDILNQKTVDLENLQMNTVYQAKVVRICPDFEGDDSNILSFTTPCSTPATPTNLSASLITEKTATFNWSAPSVFKSDYFQVHYRLIGTLKWTIVGVPGQTYKATNLISGAFYEAKVYQVCGSNLSATSNIISFNTYCTSAGQSSSNDWIDLVGLETLNNPTGNDGGYKSYLTLTMPVLRQVYNYSISFSAGGSPFSRSYTRYWKAWIDFNHNGSFEDIEDQIMAISSSSTSILTANFLVPANAAVGSTRMRVSVSQGGYPPSCETFPNGEVEDYYVNIANPQGVSSSRSGNADNPGSQASLDLSTEEIKVYPNPVSNFLRLSGPGGQKQIVITDLVGREIYNGVGKDEMDVSSLAPGIYFLTIFSGSKKTFKFTKL